MADVFVNDQKKERAEEILRLVTGKKVALTDDEQDRKSRFAQHLASADIDPTSKEALAFIYEKLGGLVRTEAEEKKAKEKKERIRRSKKIVVE